MSTTTTEPQATNPFGNANTLTNAYQKMGTDVEGLTTKQALKATGLADWGQHLVTPSIMDATGSYDPGYYRFNVATIPGKGPTILGSVTKNYQPIQIEEALTPVIDNLDGIGFQPVTMGAYHNGKAIFALFRVPGTIGGKADPIDPYFLVTKRNDGNGAMLGVPTAIRMRCQNEVRSIMRIARQSQKDIVRITHTLKADVALMEQAEVILGLTSDWDRALAKEVRELQKQKVAKKAYTEQVIPAALGKARPDEKGRTQAIWDRQFDELVAAWDSPAHADGNTAWRAWNAVSEWEQHHRMPNQVDLGSSVLQQRQPHTKRAEAVLASMA